MAEINYVYFLPASVTTITGHTKRQRVREILSWIEPPVELPAELAEVLDRGIAGAGAGFHTYKWASISNLIRFGVAWKGLSADARTRALADPWIFKQTLDGVHMRSGGTYAKEALLHLVHPDTFEAIVSRGEKGMLVQRFSSLVTDAAADVDRQIAEIRDKLEQRFGEGFDFYATVPVMAMWKPAENRWASFVYWAGRFRESQGFDAEERDYKLALAEDLAPARHAVLDQDPDWHRHLKHGLESRHNNLVGWRERDHFLRWGGERAGEALDALRAVWLKDQDPTDAVAAFVQRLPKDVVGSPGQRVAIGSVLLMASDPYRCPPYRPTPLRLAYKLTDFGAEENEEAARYRHALEFFDAVVDHAVNQGVDLRDRLDAQSVTWAVTSNETPEAWGLEPWPALDVEALQRYRKSSGGLGEIPPEEGEDGEARPMPRPGRPSLAGLAHELLIDVEHLEEIADLLDTKHQVVFYGPPGTGKTYVARALAATLAGDPARVRLVQFHPSYAYEDFVEGFRPRLASDGPGFELTPGPLKRIAEQALANPGFRHFLVIDEMNRGNLAKVMGELYFLLEYRDTPVELQYSATPFTLPANLYFIGTMNTADRSIALLDAALRRRFAFAPFFPDREPISGLLGRWLARNRPEMTWVARLIDAANVRLADRNGAIGPSFFLHADLDDARLGVIWRHEVMPYLEDHFFDDPRRLADFELERLRATLAKEAGGDGAEPTSAEEG
jgi:5-methylcytosine-specific restriction enzyme B